MPGSSHRPGGPSPPRLSLVPSDPRLGPGAIDPADRPGPASDRMLVGATLLLVDEDAPARASLRAALEHRHEVVEAAGGLAAIEVLRQRSVDLVVLDAMMSEPDAFEICGRLQRDPAWCGLPVVFVSAYASPTLELHALELGAVDFVVKPVDDEVLRLRVDEHLQRARQAARDRRWSQETVAELTASQGLLEAEVGRLERLIDGLPVAAWEEDPEGRLVRVNAAFARLVGQAPESLVGRERAGALGFEPATGMGGQRRVGVPERWWHGWVSTGSGHRLPMTLRLHRLPADGALPLGRVGVLQPWVDLPEGAAPDIGEVSAGQPVLDPQVVERLAGVGSWVLDLNAGTVRCSPQAAELVGLAAHEQPSLRELLFRVHPADRAELHQRWRQALRTGRLAVEVRTVAMAGGRWLGLTAELEPGRDGLAHRVHGTVVDRTRERAQQAELAAVRQRTQQVLDGLAAFPWEWDPDGDLVRFPDTRELPVPVPVRPAGVERAQLLALIHPEDVAGASQLLAEQELVTAGSRPELEFRIRGVRGTWRWIRVIVQGEVPASPTGRITGVAIDVTDDRRNVDAVAEAYRSDRLTGLRNQDALVEGLRPGLDAVARGEAGLAVICLDLDGFGAIEERLGHEQADEVLRLVAGRLRGLVATSAQVARLGGDVFALAVLVPPGADGVVDGLLDRVQQRLALPLTVGRTELTLTAGIGVARAEPGSRLAPARLLRRAELARDQAKLRGGGQVREHDAADDQRRRERFRRSEQLRTALRADELRLHYQPKVSLVDGSLRGVEALLRWEHPQRGLLPPAAFIDALEDEALALEVGGWVLTRALEQLVRWQRDGLTTTVSVNVSTGELEDLDILTRVRDALAAEPELAATQLQLELLETSLLGDLDRAVVTVGALRELGVSVALDDFGVGASSLALLHRLPVDELKIDASFVRVLPDDEVARTAVRSMLALAGELGVSVVAEGVERVEHGVALRALGCRIGQGYAIARPMPADQVGAWLASWELPAPWRRVPTGHDGALGTAARPGVEAPR